MLPENRVKAIVAVAIGVLLQAIGWIVSQTGDTVGIVGGIVFGLAGISVFIWGCMNFAKARWYRFSLWILLIAMLSIVAHGVGVQIWPRPESPPAIGDQDMVSATDITSRKILRAEIDSGRGNNLHVREIVIIFEDGKKYLTRNHYGDTHPKFAPDGQSIAFVRTEDTNGDGSVNWDDNGDICLMNLDGTGFRNLTETPSAQESTPSWSPDGKEIAFYSNRHGHGDVCGDVYKVTVATNEVQRMTTNSGWGAHTAWSPDGKLIAFYSGDKNGSYLTVIPAEGGEMKRLTPDVGRGGWGLGWTADGKISFPYRGAHSSRVKPDGTDLRNEHRRSLEEMLEDETEEKLINQFEYGWWTVFTQDSD